MEVIESIKRFDQAISILPAELISKLQKLSPQIKASAQEIRLRAGRPVTYTVNGENIIADDENLSQRLIESILYIICESSIHTYQDNIAEGFVTTVGGHRVGICGSAVINNGVITGIRDYSGLNIRIARQIKGCADQLISFMGDGHKVEGMLIVSPPAGGKTTLIRDLARQLSNGVLEKPLRVCIIDERYEIAACFNGIPQNDVGIFTDILSGYPKGKGMMQALRSLSPEVIICDEIGEEEDVNATLYALNAGVPVIATAHAASINEIKNRPQISKLLRSYAFGKIVMLGGADKPGIITGVWNTYGGKSEGTGDDLNNSSIDCSSLSFILPSAKKS